MVAPMEHPSNKCSIIAGSKETDLVELLSLYSNQTRVLSSLSRILQFPWQDIPEPTLPSRRNRLSPDKELELVADYQQGSTVYALAERFQVSRQTVSAVLARHGIARRYNLLDDQTVQQAHRLYQAGWSLARLADHYHVSTRTVLNAFQRSGLPTRPVGTNQWTT